MKTTATNIREETKKFTVKQYTRFKNYHNSKKWFILYLIVLTICLLFPPLLKVTSIQGDKDTSYSLLFSTAFLRSLLVILISLIFLIGRNLSMKIKKLCINFFSLREDEPLVDFALLWVITSVFMGIVDTIGIASNVSGTIKLTSRAIIDQILLLAGLIRSFVFLWKSAQKNTKQTKILNIVTEPLKKEDEHEDRKTQHLFDHLNDEEE